MGTPAYMPPEQARGEVEDLDERSDVFGLGAILCEILTGAPPYVATTREDLLRLARKGYVDDARARLTRSGADRALIDLTVRCLAPLPAERPRDAAEVARVVRSYLESLEARARALELRATRTRWRVSLAAVLFVAATGGLVAWLSVANETRARIDRNDHATRAAMREAEILRDKARDRADWEIAEQAADKAVALARADVPSETQRAAADLLADVEHAARIWRLLDDLKMLREKPGDPRPEEYRETFLRALDIDMESGPPEDVARRLAETGRGVELAVALDDWARVWATPNRDKSARLDEIARLLDDDGWRTEVRRAVSQLREVLGVFDTQSPEIRALLEQAPEKVSGDFLSVVAGRLFDEAAATLALEAARLGVQRDPSNFLAHITAASVLSWGLPGESAASAPHYLAALALKDQDGSAWDQYSRHRLVDFGDVEGAIDAFATALRIEPKVYGYRKWHDLMLHGDLSGKKRALGRVAEICEKVIDSDDRHGRPRTVRSYYCQVLAGVLLHFPERLASRETIERARREVRETLRSDAASLYLLARALEASGRRDEALRTMQEALELPADRERNGNWGWHTIYTARLRASFGRDLRTYGSIDHALEEPEVLVDEGSSWRFFPGTEEPSEGSLAWTEVAFDDSSWQEKTAPIGFGLGEVVSEVDGYEKYTSIYLRRRFHVADPGRYQKLMLRVRVDDAVAVYLNGREVGQRRLSLVPRPIPRTTSWVGVQNEEPPPFEWITVVGGELVEGENVIALQVVNMSLRSSDLFLEARLEGTLVPPLEAERNAARLEEYRSIANDAARVAYFEARLRQVRGDIAGAVESFNEVLQSQDRAAAGEPEPYLRLAECLRETGHHEKAVQVLRAGLRGDRLRSDMLHLWLEHSLVHLVRSLPEALESIRSLEVATPSGELDPEHLARTSVGYARNVEAFLRALGGTGRVRLDCGSLRMGSSEASPWIGDLFFLGGNPRELAVDATGTDSPEIYRTFRGFWGPIEAVIPAYRIPLPRGRYRVALHFAELFETTRTGKYDCSIDVIVDGKHLLRDHDLMGTSGWGVAVVHETEVELDGKRLEIDVVRHADMAPHIHAIEIERLD